MGERGRERGRPGEGVVRGREDRSTFIKISGLFENMTQDQHTPETSRSDSPYVSELGGIIGAVILLRKQTNMITTTINDP